MPLSFLNDKLARGVKSLHDNTAHSRISKMDFDVDGYDARRDRLLGLANSRGGSPHRDAQKSLGHQMKGRANGQGLISSRMLRDAMDQNIQQQRGLLAAAPASQQGLGLRAASMGLSSGGQQIGAGAAQAGISEASAAQNALGQHYGAARGQDDKMLLDMLGRERLNAAMQQQGQISKGEMLAISPTFEEKILDGVVSLGSKFI